MVVVVVVAAVVVVEGFCFTSQYPGLAPGENPARTGHDLAHPQHLLLVRGSACHRVEADPRGGALPAVVTMRLKVIEMTTTSQLLRPMQTNENYRALHLNLITSPTPYQNPKLLKPQALNRFGRISARNASKPRVLRFRVLYGSTLSELGIYSGSIRRGLSARVLTTGRDQGLRAYL